jgi:hypothetical protein
MSQQSVIPNVEHPEWQFQAMVGSDKRRWKYYSPHHELPLSSVSSLGLHLAALAILITAGVLASRWSRNEDIAGLPISVMNDPSEHNPRPPHRPLWAEPIQPRDDVGHGLSPQPGLPRANLPQGERLNGPSAAVLPLPSVPPASNDRLIEGVNAATTALNNVSDRVSDKIRSTPPAGNEGGTPGGIDTPGGIGSPGGPGEIRSDRVRRWQVNFSVAGPEDHLRQFAGLGAILAVPDGDGRYYVYRELSRRPIVGKVEDISTINRIWFIDSKEETATGIARLLGIPEQPKELIAFFPQRLEQQMAALENQLYPGAKKTGKKVFFEVVRRGAGYQVQLAEAQP